MSALKNGVLLRNRNEKAIIFKSCMVDNLFYKSLYKYSAFIILNNCI